MTETHYIEKVLKVEEYEDEQYAGYAVTTDKQVVKLLIGRWSDCCERWGYLMSEDNLDEFIGADLLGVKLTDTSRNVKRLEEDFKEHYGEQDSYDYMSTMFVDIETSKGVLQFVAYNEHNGYYGHEVKVESEQLTHSDVI